MFFFRSFVHSLVWLYSSLLVRVNQQQCYWACLVLAVLYIFIESRKYVESERDTEQAKEPADWMKWICLVNNIFVLFACLLLNIQLYWEQGRIIIFFWMLSFSNGSRVQVLLVQGLFVPFEGWFLSFILNL